LSDFYFFGTDLKKVVALNVQMTAKNKSGKKEKKRKKKETFSLLL